MANRQDFRPKLLDEDDPVFVGTMSVFMALAAVLMIYVWNTDPVESVSLAEFQDRFVEMVIDAAEKEKEEQTIEETSDEGEKVKEEEDPPEEKEPERKPKTKDEKEAQEAARLEKKKEDVIAKSKLLAAIIGTRGRLG